VDTWDEGISSHRARIRRNHAGEISGRGGADRAFEEGSTIATPAESCFKERKVERDPVNRQIV
jgi:hypothetical protein